MKHTVIAGRPVELIDDVHMQIREDGGKSFKHSPHDYHCCFIEVDDAPQSDLIRPLAIILLVIVAGIVTAVAVWKARPFDAARDAEIMAAIEAEAAAKKAVDPCTFTIAQFGPGERWRNHHHYYECAAGAQTSVYGEVVKR